MVSLEEKNYWKDSKATADLKKDISQSMESMAVEILNRSYPDPNRDQYIRGILAGLRYVFEWEPEIIQEGAEDEEV